LKNSYQNCTHSGFLMLLLYGEKHHLHTTARTVSYLACTGIQIMQTQILLRSVSTCFWVGHCVLSSSYFQSL